MHTTLKKIGLRIQLGHQLGDPCANPVPSSGDDFVVVSSHTIDEVTLDYCNCGGAKLRPIQLLRMGWYPATGTNPRSAATFVALRRFDLMCLESKCSAYEFYNSLSRETDNTGLEPSRVSFRFHWYAPILISSRRTATKSSCEWLVNGRTSTC